MQSIKKNVLIITTVSGFLDKFEKENVKILIDMGYAIHYAANTSEPNYAYGEEEIRALGVVTHHIDIERSPYKLNNIKAFCQIRKLIKEYDISIIHCHTPVGGMLGRLVGIAFRSRGIQIIYTAHGFHFYKGAPLINNSLYYWVEKWLAKYTDVLIVINEEDYKYAKTFNLRMGGQVFKIPGIGIDEKKFSPILADKLTEARQQLGISETDFFLVSVGELNENKNHRVVLEALSELRRQGQDISFIKYGICGTGFFADRMKTWIQEMELQDTVTMYGYCDDVTSILGCADVSLFPSRREGLGMAALESLAMAIPVIAADNRGTREYMEHMKNGYVCHYDKVDDFVAGITTFRDMKAGQYEQIKKYCRDSVEKFDKKYTNDIMRALYKLVDKRVTNA